jgi:hypothetical protein
MRRSLVVAAVVPAVFAAHVAVASASCTVGGHYYDGWHKNQTVADGGKLNAKITFNSGTYYGSANQTYIVAWDGVSGGAYWLQAGINYDPVYGRVLYIEYNNSSGHSFVSEGPITVGSPYTAIVQKVSAGVWDAVAGQHAIDNIAVTGMTGSDFNAESESGTTTCNAMNFDFASVAPWDIYQFDYDSQDGPYRISNITTYGWTSSGP